MTVLLTGSSGLVGSSLYSKLIKKPMTVGHRELNNNSESDLKRMFSQTTKVIHCGAPTNLDLGEINKSQHYADIVQLTEKLCRVTPKNVHFIYISSTGVYGDTQKLPYSESDSCTPMSFHHRCKFAAEQIVTEYKQRNTILRLGWVYDDLNYSPNDFVMKIIKVLNNNTTLETNDKQKGCPTPTSLIFEVISELLRFDVDRKIINVVTSGCATRKEYISFINQIAKTRCQITRASRFHRVAKVSTNETATNLLLSQVLGKKIPSWEIYLQKRIESALG